MVLKYLQKQKPRQSCRFVSSSLGDQLLPYHDKKKSTANFTRMAPPSPPYIATASQPNMAVPPRKRNEDLEAQQASEPLVYSFVYNGETCCDISSQGFMGVVILIVIVFIVFR